MQRIDAADRFLAELGADIRHGGNRAFYHPAATSFKCRPLDVCNRPASNRFNVKLATGEQSID